MKNVIAYVLLLGTLTLPQVAEWKTKAKVSIDNAEKQVFKVDVPKPDVVKECPCGGKGYIVQGDGHRSDCPGIDGQPCKFKKKNGDAPKVVVETPRVSVQVKPAPKATVEKPKAAPAVENGIVVMYTRPGCLACRNWLTNIAPKIMKQGWRVKEREATEPTSVPYFGVIMNGKEYRMPGYLTVEGLDRFNSQFLQGKQK